MEMTENEDVLKALQEAHRSGNQEEIVRLEREAFENTKGKVVGLSSKIDEAHKKVEEVNAQPSSRKVNGERRRIYKEWIVLYREAKALSDFCSKVKKDMRESGASGGGSDGGDDNGDAAE